MKATLLIEEGRTQLVITPETSLEKDLIKAIQNGGKFQAYWGTFYDCKGGWTRQQRQHAGGVFDLPRAEQGPESLILVCDGVVDEPLQQVS